MKELIFYVATDAMHWGKGFTLKEAKKNAKVGTRIKYKVWGAIFHPFETEADRKNIFTCITADQISGGPEFYKDNRTQEDTDMINKYLIGWTIIEDTTK